MPRRDDPTPARRRNLASGPRERLAGGVLTHDHLVEVFSDIGREVAVYSDGDDPDKVRSYLDNDEDREAIAAAGSRRAIAEHTYVHRFLAINARIVRRLPVVAPTPSPDQDA